MSDEEPTLEDVELSEPKQEQPVNPQLERQFAETAAALAEAQVTAEERRQRTAFGEAVAAEAQRRFGVCFALPAPQVGAGGNMNAGQQAQAQVPLVQAPPNPRVGGVDANTP